MVTTGQHDTLLAMIEIWDSASALKGVQGNEEYKAFARKVRDEGVLSGKGWRDISASMWTPVRGFVCRKGEKESMRAGIVMLAKFVTREGEGNVEGLVKVLGYVLPFLFG
jgi:hypothetical protein